MKLYNVKRNGELLTIRRTFVGRLVEAATRFGTWFPLVFAGEAIFFLPDYLHTYGSRPRDEQLVFWGALAGLAALIASIGGFVRFARRDAWILDADREKLVFQTRPLLGRTTEAEIDLERFVGVERTSQAPPRSSSLALRIRGYPDETLCRTNWGDNHFREIEEALRSFADVHSLSLDFESES